MCVCVCVCVCVYHVLVTAQPSNIFIYCDISSVGTLTQNMMTRPIIT